MTTYDVTDHDQIFKTLIKEFFREYMELFLPELAARLTLDNPALPVEFLDKEMFTDFPTGDRRHLDILAKVWTRDGTTAETVLIYNENQETEDPALTASEARDPRVLGRLLKEKRALPMDLRMLRYGAVLQDRHFPRPLIPVLNWLVPGKGSIGIARCDYHHFGVGLSLAYYRVCIPDLPAEDYLDRDNPLAYSLAVRMRPRTLSRVDVGLAARRRIIRAHLSNLRQDLLWNFCNTYATLSPSEELEMQARLEDPENRDVQEAKLTWAGKEQKKGREQGLEEGLEIGLRQNILDVCALLQIKLTEAQQGHLQTTALPELKALWRHLLDHKSWPSQG